ncbi:hypothetical protein [Terrabacter aerolatus]
MPPPTWVPHADWLPEPDWPEPPADWAFWSVASPQRVPGSGDGAGATGHDGRAVGGEGRGRIRTGQVSFPVGTVAAQSTVSLAALFPGRGRQAGSAYVVGAGDRPPTKAGREYYEPGGHTDAVSSSRSASDGWASSGPALEGPAFDGPAINGAAFEGSAVNGSVLNGSAGVLVGEVPADVATGTSDESETAGVLAPGIRLSPLLRLVAHPSGLRVQFRVGGPVAAALAEVMTPAIEAATALLVAHPSTSSGDGRGGSRDVTAARPRGLRRLLGGRASDPERLHGPRLDDDRHAQSPLSIHDLARRALDARRGGDRDAALAVERDLRSLHRLGFVTIHPPAVPAPVPLSGAEEASIRDRVLDALGATAPGLPRARSAELRTLAAERAESLVRASNVARRLLTQRRAALAAGAWQLLRSHDPATVVAVVDEALRLSASDVTCLDAGTDPVTGRDYVTVLVRFPTIGIVAEEQRDDGPAGRAGWRPRTARERNVVYAAGLASAVLAAAKQVVSLAPATDDVNVVVVRHTRNGRGVEPVYVGRFDREDVSLRHPEADPLPLVASSAMPHGIRVHGADREVTALEHAADVDGALRELVDTCRAADARGRSGRDA